MINKNYTDKINEEIVGDFMAIRKFCLEKLETLYCENNNSLKFEIDNELWTLKRCCGGLSGMTGSMVKQW